MKKAKREDFARFRLTEVEKKRINDLVAFTGRKQSDLYRDAMFEYVKSRFPEFLVDINNK